MPIHTSRPTTFISVKARTDASGVPAMPCPAKPAIGLRRGNAGGIGEFRCADPRAGNAGRQIAERARTSGNTKIITIAQRITSVIAIGASSFFAPTAPAMAIAAETPQTAPPAPSVAAKRRSSPSLIATK